MSDETFSQPQTFAPAPDLKAFDKLVGAWRVSGGVDGVVSYEWMDGGYYLLQRFDFEHEGHRVKGIEVIGHLRPFGESPTADVRSRVFDNVGNTLDYVYEVDGDVLTIWAGEKGSPAYFRGSFSAGGNALSGAWVYPGGGGYSAKMARLSSAT